MDKAALSESETNIFRIRRSEKVKENSEMITTRVYGNLFYVFYLCIFANLLSMGKEILNKLA